MDVARDSFLYQIKPRSNLLLKI